MLGTALGGLLALVFNAPAAVFHRQPAHQRGRTHRATWEVHTPWPESGVEVFAASAPIPVVARLSRGLSLPAPWPDVSGFAVRFPDDAALLFASTGTGPRTRRLLAARRPGAADPMTTMLPLHTRLGRVDLRAQTEGRTVRVMTSLEDGPWVDRVRVRLGDPPGAVVRFDPLHTPRGLAWSDFWAAARGPAYTLARRITPGAE